MQESYPSLRDDYDIMNPHEKMAISLLLNGMVPDYDRAYKIALNKAIKRVYEYCISQNIAQIPWGLLEVERIILVPVFQISRPSTRPKIEYSAKLKRYIEGIRLLSVKLEVI